MKFYYKYSNDIYNGEIYMTNDTSILFSCNSKVRQKLDYTVSLGGNPRYLIDLSHDTGQCGNMRCFMDGQKIFLKKLDILKNKKGKLYFESDDVMTEYSGEMYMQFEDTCYYDEENSILCFGNPDAQGEVIEFLSNTFAVIKDDRLFAIFMKINSLSDKIAVRKGRVCRTYK